MIDDYLGLTVDSAEMITLSASPLSRLGEFWSSPLLYTVACETSL